MRGRLTIRTKLTAAFAAAFLLVLVLAGLFVYQRVSSDLSESIDTGLRSRADDLAAVAASPDPSADLRGARLVEDEEGFSQIIAPDGTVIASSLPSGTGVALDPRELERASRGSILITAGVQGIEGEARILARPASAGAGSLTVVAGSSTEDREETLAGLAGAFAVGAPLALLLASGLGYLLAGRALAPVEAMRRRAAEITLERSGERLPLPRAADEIRQLGETLNTMLDRIEASLERERVFVADASHELRTPLANLRTELELADRPGRSPEEVLAALRSAAEEVDRLSQLAEDLLVIARSDQGRLPIKREATALRALFERVRDRFGRRAREAGREIELDAPAGMRAEVDPLRLEQALGNLVDNALRHGSGTIRLGASLNGDRVLLEVSDQGPGFPAGFEATAFERFSRADEGRTGGGAGLGMAIAEATAAAHGGEARVTDGGDPRTTVRISLPA